MTKYLPRITYWTLLFALVIVGTQIFIFPLGFWWSLLKGAIVGFSSALVASIVRQLVAKFLGVPSYIEKEESTD